MYAFNSADTPDGPIKQHPKLHLVIDGALKEKALKHMYCYFLINGNNRCIHIIYNITHFNNIKANNLHN